MTIFSRAAGVERIAVEVIADHHDHLVGTPLRCIFRDTHQTTKGKAVYASTRLVGGREAWLAAGMPEDGEEPERFFLIEVAEDVWAVLSTEARVALVDHELCHCRMEPDSDGNLVPRLVGHDVEEFADVVRRRGLWRPDIEAFIMAANQPQLFEVVQ